MTDRDLLHKHLAEAEAHIALGRGHIDKQHRIISRLVSKGADATSAKELLAQLEETQVLHEAGRDRILDELDSAGGAGDPQEGPLRG